MKLGNPLSSPAVIRRIANPRLQIVANRGAVIGHSTDRSGTITRLESRYQFKIGPQCSDLRFLFQNFKVGQGTGEADGANPITVRAALETNQVVTTYTESAAHYPLHFGGQLTRVIDPGAPAAMTDPLAVDFAAGTLAWIRTGVEVTAGQAIPIGHAATLGGNAERSFESSNASHQIYTTGELVAGTNGVATSQGYGPLAILGVAKEVYPAAIIYGDSIPYGQGDVSTGDGVGNRGYLARALGALNVPYSNISRSSDTPAQNRDFNSWRKRSVLQYATDVFITLGINQLIPTDVAVQTAYVLTIADSCRARGARAHFVLIGPQTTSSDAWATAANQTIDPAFAADRAVLNQNIIDAHAAGLIDGYVNPASTWEDPANPGKFLPGATTDGTHPTSAYHILAAAVVQSYAAPRLFQW